MLGAAPPRVGLLAGKIDVPADFDAMGAETIRAAFEGAEGAGAAGR
jgi:hypothetical protein